MFIDSHAHLTGEDFTDEEQEALLQRALQADVRTIVNICTDVKSLQRGLELNARHPFVFLTAATTPHDVEKEGESAFPFIAECARQKKLVAVGETGLDYYYEHSNREVQKHFLKRYLHLALECQLPVVIHCRNAFEDLFATLDADYPLGKGVLHCFTGTASEAKELVSRGWMISFSGIVTFKKSEELRQVALQVPLENLLIETDTPYLAPQSHRGKRNEPAFIVETAQTLATLKNIPLEALAAVTTANASRVFSL